MSLIEVSDIPVPSLVCPLSSTGYFFLTKFLLKNNEHCCVPFVCLYYLNPKQSDRFAQPVNRNDGDGHFPIPVQQIDLLYGYFLLLEFLRPLVEYLSLVVEYLEPAGPAPGIQEDD